MALPLSTQRVDIALDERSYPILIGSGLLDCPASFDGVRASANALIVTNTTVGPLYADRLARGVRGAVAAIVAPAGAVMLMRRIRPCASTGMISTHVSGSWSAGSGPRWRKPASISS